VEHVFLQAVWLVYRKKIPRGWLHAQREGDHMPYLVTRQYDYMAGVSMTGKWSCSMVAGQENWRWYRTSSVQCGLVTVTESECDGMAQSYSEDRIGNTQSRSY